MGEEEDSLPESFMDAQWLFMFIVFNGIFTVVMVGVVRYLRSGKEDKIGSVKLKRNRLTNSKYFKKFCKDAFEQVDIDKSNSLDKTEVYCAVLLVYTYLIAYSAYSVPPPREFVLNLVEELDTDDSGELSLEEFEVLAAILCHHIANRITTELLFTFVIGPYVASQAIILMDNYLTAPSFIPDSVVETLEPLRDSIFVTLTIMCAVPRLLKLYESATADKADHAKQE